MIRSSSSQDDESVFLDEGLFYSSETIFSPFSSPPDDETKDNNTSDGKINSFFTENYEHDNSTASTTIDDETSTRELQRRKSVSSRFRSVSKDAT